MLIIIPKHQAGLVRDVHAIFDDPALLLGGLQSGTMIAKVIVHSLAPGWLTFIIEEASFPFFGETQDDAVSPRPGPQELR